MNEIQTKNLEGFSFCSNSLELSLRIFFYNKKEFAQPVEVEKY